MLELIRSTASSLRTHAFRFALTSLGILWGTLMLVYLSASMRGMDLHYTRELEEVGPRIVWLFPGTVIKNRVGERGARGIELEPEDVERVESLSQVEHASPNIALWSSVVRANRRTKLLTVYGVDSDSWRIRNFEAERGRFLSPSDVETRARVAFLGPEAARRLFGREDVVGETIQIESLAVRVVGVARAKGDQLVNMGGQDDQAILMPFTTVRRWFSHAKPLEVVLFEPTTREASWGAIRDSREVLGLHHDFDPDLETALSFVNIQEILGRIHLMFFGLRIFLVGAGLVTLLVGAVGVMNIMLVVVGERTREIGLRKAVGATNRAIFSQFLGEALAVCLTSGAVGALLGVALVRLVAQLLSRSPGFSSPPVLDSRLALSVLAVLVVVGVASGLVPAVRAARVDPSVSLRAR